MSGIPDARFFRKRPSARSVNLPACRKSNRTFSGTGLGPYKALPSGSSCLQLALDVRRKHNYFGVAVLMHGAASLVDYRAPQVHGPLANNAVQTGDFAIVHRDLTQTAPGGGLSKRMLPGARISVCPLAYRNEKMSPANLLRRWTSQARDVAESRTRPGRCYFRILSRIR